MIYLIIWTMMRKRYDSTAKVQYFDVGRSFFTQNKIINYGAFSLWNLH